MSFQKAITAFADLVDRYDTFGERDRDMSLFSVALGTLRKDRLLTQDIVTLNSTGSEGLGSMALSRIITEDYLHLLFLNHNQDKLESNIDRFNTHPHIQHYIGVQMLKELGFNFDKPEERALVTRVIAEFETHKAKFLRRKESDTFDPDDYFRTWTGASLDSLIMQSGLTTTDADKKSLRFMTETYDLASSVIHHNSFLIWLFATQDTKLFLEEYPEFSQQIVFIILNKLIALVIEIEQTVSKNEEKQAALLNELADIMELA